MRQQMPLLLAFFIMAAMLIPSGCGQLPDPVQINDETLYFLKGPSGAVQMNFLTPGQVDLTKAQWDAISEGMVAMPSSAFADFDKEIGKLCSEVPCDYATVQAFHSLVAAIKLLSVKIK